MMERFRINMIRHIKEVENTVMEVTTQSVDSIGTREKEGREKPGINDCVLADVNKNGFQL